MKFPFFLGYTNHRDRTWVVCCASKSNAKFTKDVINAALTLNPKPRGEILDWGSENYFTNGYYCLQIILFGCILIIRLRFEVRPATEIYVIFLRICVGKETATQCPLRLIMTMGLITSSYSYASNLKCCFSCIIVCACCCWGWTNGGMWCSCLTKQQIIIWIWWLKRRPELFIKWCFLFRHIW